MSSDDDFERLLREVDASLSGGSGASGSAVAPKGAEVSRKPPADSSVEPSRTGTAVRTGVVAGAVCGVGVFVGTVLLSWLPGDQAAFQSGVGAFVGAFLTGAVLSLRRGR